MLQDELTVLELLIRQEVAVKRLYEAFAIMFQEHEEFWTNIANEEQYHADMLIKLRSRKDMENWLVDEMKLLPETLKKSIAYADDKRKLALKGEVNPQQAFSLAENIERFLVDGVFIKLEQKNLTNTPMALITLANETRKHVELVLEKQRILFRK